MPRPPAIPFPGHPGPRKRPLLLDTGWDGTEMNPKQVCLGNTQLQEMRCRFRRARPRRSSPSHVRSSDRPRPRVSPSPAGSANPSLAGRGEQNPLRRKQQAPELTQDHHQTHLRSRCGPPHQQRDGISERPKNAQAVRALLG